MRGRGADGGARLRGRRRPRQQTPRNRVQGPFLQMSNEGLAGDRRRQPGTAPSSPAARCCPAWSSAVGGRIVKLLRRLRLPRRRRHEGSSQARRRRPSPVGLAREFGKSGVTVNAIAPRLHRGRARPRHRAGRRRLRHRPQTPHPPLRPAGGGRGPSSSISAASTLATWTGQTFHINGGEILQ